MPYVFEDRPGKPLDERLQWMLEAGDPIDIPFLDACARYWKARADAMALESRHTRGNVDRMPCQSRVPKRGL